MGGGFVWQGYTEVLTVADDGEGRDDEGGSAGLGRGVVLVGRDDRQDADGLAQAHVILSRDMQARTAHGFRTGVSQGADLNLVRGP